MPRHQYRTVIKREHPRRQRLVWGISALLVVVAITSAYFAGEHRGSREPVPWNAEADELRAQLVEAQTRSAIDAQATRDLTESLAEARGIIEERERELAFYKEVLAPEELSRGPRLRQPVFSRPTSLGSGATSWWCSREAKPLAVIAGIWMSISWAFWPGK